MLTKPLFQTENRVWRTYRGGKQLDLFLGKSSSENSFFPEDWISSFVEAKNKNYIPGEGLSHVLVDGNLEKITDVVTPEDLGPGRTDSGVLIKLLDAAERLGIQVHPTPDFSRKHFGTNYGKTECWHILDATEDASIYIGFKEGITKEKWAALFDSQDIEGMLHCLHRFAVKNGDTILVTAGTPHAIGAGCFLLEIQEPSDYTMRVEKITLAGDALTPMQIHYGVGEEAMLDCFHYIPLTKEEAYAKFFLQKRGTHLVTYEDTPCFALQEITEPNTEIVLDSFVTVVCIESGTLVFDANSDAETSYDVKKGDKVLIPYGCKSFIAKSGAFILCHPPKKA